MASRNRREGCYFGKVDRKHFRNGYVQWDLAVAHRLPDGTVMKVGRSRYKEERAAAEESARLRSLEV